MQAFKYFATLISALVFVGAFFPMMIAVFALFDKKKPPVTDFPKAYKTKKP